MNREPLVSICLPNLNTRPFLDERMETILGQTFKDWVSIICDGYPNDGTWGGQKFKDDTDGTLAHNLIYPRNTSHESTQSSGAVDN